MIPLLALSLSVLALACLGVIIWRIAARVSAGHLRNVSVSREWLQRQAGGRRE
jgi:hypothetical protein